jgi:uncharacterized protein GlcG (DUF336 family)
MWKEDVFSTEQTSSEKGVIRVTISIDVARRILEASKQRARELRSPVSIAIVDAGGHLVIFERMMSPYGWATVEISIAKASTAVMFNQATDAVAQWGSAIPGFASSMATMTHGQFIMAAGGWPIRMGGATIGGIGISGGNAPGRDDEIARAGLAALEKLAPAIPVQSPPASVAAPVPAQTQSIQMQSPVPGDAQGQMQHSRPYMQPSASYPSIPPSSSDIGSRQQSQQGNGTEGTHYLAPDQVDEKQYNDDSGFTEYNDNRSGGQS